MILILSFKHYEQGTDPVIDWLHAKKADFLRISSQDLLDKANRYSLNIADGTLILNGRKVDLNAVKVIWDRRWQDSGLVLNDYPQQDWPYDQLIFEHDNEIRYLSEYLFHCFKDKVWLGNPFSEVNKLLMLQEAEGAGLKVPRSAVINNKTDLLDFFASCSNGIISKPIHHSHYFVKGKYTYSIYTNAFNSRSSIDSLPDHFFPTLFQEKVTGEFEIRTFYLDGAFFSMAILTDPQHRDEIDIKLSFGAKTTRWVPYTLPQELENRLDALLRRTGSNTGSIDIIKCDDGAFCFIENNPGGQYSAPSHRGNLYLEEKIADWLIAHDK